MFSPDSTRIARSIPGTCEAWPVSDPTLPRSTHKIGGSPKALAFTRGGTHLAVSVDPAVLDDRDIRIYDLRSGLHVDACWRPHVHARRYCRRYAAFSSDGLVHVDARYKHITGSSVSECVMVTVQTAFAEPAALIILLDARRRGRRGCCGMLPPETWQWVLAGRCSRKSNVITRVVRTRFGEP